jgi:flavin reductase (DIM6/NTAB) family NADH-FMN oxidoreductase RutF
VTIHGSDPFATPPAERSGVRRLRGRLPAAVTLWTAYHADHRPAGLTVSSTLVVDGDPGCVLGVLDDESELYAAVRSAGRFVMAPLRDRDAQLADRFAGTMPAPGGPFAGNDWRETESGPLLVGLTSHAECVVTDVRPVGWGWLVEAELARVELAEETVRPLVHHRGRYVRLG